LFSQVHEDLHSIWEDAGLLTIEDNSIILKLIKMWKSRNDSTRRSSCTGQPRNREQNLAAVTQESERATRESTSKATLEAAAKKGPPNHSARNRGRQETAKERVFVEKLPKLFDIAAPDHLQDISRLPFLTDKHTKREMKLGGRLGLTALEKRKQDKEKDQKKRAEKEEAEKKKRFQTGLQAFVFQRAEWLGKYCNANFM
jgi:hypothetical protein